MFGRTSLLQTHRRLNRDGWTGLRSSAILQNVRSLARSLYHAGIVTEEQWFALSPAQRTSDIVMAHALAEKPDCGTSRRRETLLLDLRADGGTIWNGIDKGARYEIRRAEKEGFAVLSYAEIPDQVVAAFGEAYEILRTRKTLPPLRSSRLNALVSCGTLRVSTCTDPDGEILSWHVYVAKGAAVRLLHSVSIFDKGDSPARRATIGRANRFHHWQDILEFKRRGLSLYDFGGIYVGEADRAQKSIATFKRQFGGVSRTVFDVAVPVTWRGRIVVSLRYARFHKS